MYDLTTIIISTLITALILYISFLHFKKIDYKHLSPDLALKQLSITCAVFVTTFLTLILCKVLNAIPIEQIQTIAGSGIQIPIIMIACNFLFKKTYKQIFKENLSLDNSILSICFILSCLFAIVIIVTYLHDWSMSLLFIAIFLGKFIWFDGATLGLTRENITNFIKQKYLSFFMLFIIIFIAILLISQELGFTFVYSIFIGVDFGIGIAGIIIYKSETKRIP